MKLNQEAFKHAKSLIKAAKVVRKADWSEVQPSPDDENKFLDENNWEEYQKWYLGVDTDENEETKGRFGFPFGNFDCVYRDGLIAAKQRAAQHGYREIENAVDKLLIQMDKEPDVVTEASDESFPASDPPSWRDRR